MARPSLLPTPPRTLILAALRKSKIPLSAYDLLARLKPHGVKGPPIVYRALDALLSEGTVHKIQSTGAYVACNCAASHTHELSVLTVCAACKSVSELHDHAVIRHLSKLRNLDIPLAPHAVVELPVLCASCKNAPAGA